MGNKIKEALMEIDILKDLIAKLPAEDRKSVYDAINTMSSNAMKEVDGVLTNITEKDLNDFINELGKVKFEEVVKGKNDGRK